MNDAGVCSGTAIGPHLILSATHCFEGLTKLTVNGKQVIVRKQVDDGNDHTMLVVDITFKTWASIGGAPKPGDVVFLWGQPAFLNFMYREGHVAGYDEKDGVATTIYDYNGFPGDSGSGVFNADGAVSAVVSYAIVINYDGMQFKLMGSIPIKFTESQYAEVGLEDVQQVPH
jgi:hypothetical protein